MFDEYRFHLRSLPAALAPRGGVGSYVHTMAHALSAAGHTVHVHWVGPFVIRALWRRPLRWLRLYETFPAIGDWIGWSVAAARKVQALHRCRPVDVVEAPDHLAQGYASSFLHRPPLVVRLHSPLAVNLPAKGETPQKDHWLGFRCERAAVRRARTVTAPTARYAEFIRAFWQLGDKPILIAPNPVDEERFCPGPEERRRQNLVSYIGRLNQSKGIQIFLEAIPRVVEKIPEAQFQVVGSDEGDAPLHNSTYEQYFHNRFGSALAEKIEFEPWVQPEGLPDRYRTSTVVVVPSVGPESFSIVTAEAMSCGCAVIASDIGGIPELIAHEETGLLTPPGDVQALADALVRLLRQPELARMLGRRARQVVEQRYARGVVAAQMLKVYRHAIATQGNGRHAG